MMSCCRRIIQQIWIVRLELIIRDGLEAGRSRVERIPVGLQSLPLGCLCGPLARATGPLDTVSKMWLCFVPILDVVFIFLAEICIHRIFRDRIGRLGKIGIDQRGLPMGGIACKIRRNVCQILWDVESSALALQVRRALEVSSP